MTAPTNPHATKDSWPTQRLRFCADVNKSRMPGGLSPADEVSFVPMAAIGEYGGLDLTQSKAIEEVGSGYTPFVENDVIIAKITPCFENGKGALARGLTNGAAFGTTELHVVTCGDELLPEFAFYISISDAFRKVGEGWMYGAGGQKRVPDQFVKDFRFRLPPLTAQQTILAFLSQRLSEIDDLIAKKRRLLELLAEKRAAIITRAVTKGLNPDAPMKPSGIDWLGDIPAHWEVMRLRRLASPFIGLTYSPDDVVSEGEGTLVLRASNIQNAKLAFDDNVYVNCPIPDKLRLQAGDVLVCSRNGSRHLIGKCALIESDGNDWTFGAFTTVIRSDFGRFLYWVFNSGVFEFQAGRFLTSTINQLTIGTFKSLEVPLPPKSEQDEIIALIGEKAAEIDESAALVQRAIDQLTEYRAALITNAVIGELEVA